MNIKRGKNQVPDQVEAQPVALSTQVDEDALKAAVDKILHPIPDNKFCELGKHWYRPRAVTSSVRTNLKRTVCGWCSDRGTLFEEKDILAFNFCKKLEFSVGHFIPATAELVPEAPEGFIGSVPFGWFTQDDAAALFDRRFDNRSRIVQTVERTVEYMNRTKKKGAHWFEYKFDIASNPEFDSAPPRSTLRPILKAERELQDIEALEVTLKQRMEREVSRKANLDSRILHLQNLRKET